MQVATSSASDELPGSARAGTGMNPTGNDPLRVSAPRATALGLVVVLYVACSVGAAFRAGHAGDIEYLLYSAQVGIPALLFVLFVVAYRASWLFWVERPERLTRRLIEDLGSRYLTRERLGRAIPVILLMNVFMSVFSSMKFLIPVFHPYAWDQRLSALDSWLHGGVAPWEWLQPLLGHPAITFLINLVYNLWFLVLFAVLYWQAFSLADLRLRMQFFCSLVLSWAVNGTLLAVLLSSGGPCFYRYFTDGPDPYGPLLAYLGRANEQFPIWSLRTQDYLWSAYEQGGLSVGVGISAMPSVHVATVVTIALLGWRRSRALGWCASLFALLILLGSVHLGWHYAVDGYLATIVSALIWYAVGWIFQPRAVRLPAAPEPARELARPC